MRRLSILIVESAHEAGALFSTRLKGHYTVCVPSVAEALRAVLLFEFDLAIGPLDMPGDPGVSFFEVMRQRQPQVKLLGVARTASRFLPELPAGRGAGPADITTEKPFDENTLLLAVRTCWEKEPPIERHLATLHVATALSPWSES